MLFTTMQIIRIDIFETNCLQRIIRNFKTYKYLPVFGFINTWNHSTLQTNDYQTGIGGFPRGVMVKAMDCVIVLREFVLQSRYYVHFRANTLGKGMNPLILPAMG